MTILRNAWISFFPTYHLLQQGQRKDVIGGQRGLNSMVLWIWKSIAITWKPFHGAWNAKLWFRKEMWTRNPHLLSLLPLFSRKNNIRLLFVWLGLKIKFLTSSKTDDIFCKSCDCNSVFCTLKKLNVIYKNVIYRE